VAPIPCEGSTPPVEGPLAPVSLLQADVIRQAEKTKETTLVLVSWLRVARVMSKALGKRKSIEWSSTEPI